MLSCSSDSDSDEERKKRPNTVLRVLLTDLAKTPQDVTIRSIGNISENNSLFNDFEKII